MTDVLAQNLVHFSRLMRSLGLRVLPRTSEDLIAAAGAVGLADRDDVYHAFKAVSVVRSTEIPLFDEAFALFFGSGRALLADVEGAWNSPDQAAAEIVTLPVLRAAGVAESLDETEDLSDIVGGSYTERLTARDFADLTATDREEVRRIISRMVWRAADTASRRWRPSSAGRRPDLRRTFRGLLGPEGDLMPLSLAERRPRRRPLVVLADISGSMERYTEMFLHFIHAAQGRLGRVEAFRFCYQAHSDLARDTPTRHRCGSRAASLAPSMTGRAVPVLGRLSRSSIGRGAAGSRGEELSGSSFRTVGTPATSIYSTSK